MDFRGSTVVGDGNPTYIAPVDKSVTLLLSVHDIQASAQTWGTMETPKERTLTLESSDSIPRPAGIQSWWDVCRTSHLVHPVLSRFLLGAPTSPLLTLGNCHGGLPVLSTVRYWASSLGATQQTPAALPALLVRTTRMSPGMASCPGTERWEQNH